MSLIKWLNEMAFVSGVLQNSQHSKEFDWDNFYKKDNNLELLTSYIPNYKIYKHGTNYFLTDKEDNYKGHVQIEDTKLGKNFENPVQIISSNQNGSVKGFYNIMFTGLLTHTNIDAIFSDDNLSTNAINSYKRLSNSNLSVLKYKQQKNEYYYINSKDVDIEDFGIVYCVVPKKTKVELTERYNNYVNSILNKQTYIHEYYKKESEILFMMLYSSKDGVYKDLI